MRASFTTTHSEANVALISVKIKSLAIGLTKADESQYKINLAITVGKVSL
jgi:hypothetical protein